MKALAEPAVAGSHLPVRTAITLLIALGWLILVSKLHG